MAEAISVNLPRMGDAECDYCGAPGGVHKGSCAAYWMAEVSTDDDLARHRALREYKEKCLIWGIDPDPRVLEAATLDPSP